MAEHELSILLRAKGAVQTARDIGKVDSALGRIGSRAGKGLKTAATNLGTIGAVAGGLAVAGIAKSVEAASSLEQSMGAVESIYGKTSATIARWGEQAADAAGLSKREVNEMAAVTGAQLQGMGFGLDESATKAIELQKRAADMAATFGGPTKDAMDAISALMRGERDPIERYGVSIKAVDVKARIAAKGLDTSTAAALKNAEAIAGMELLMEQTAKTEGAFGRETDTLAGSQAILRSNLENTGAMIGTVLLPQLAKLATRLNKMIKDNQPAIKKFADQLPGVFDSLMTIVENLPWDAIKGTFVAMGTGAKAALSMFSSMPSWVQTAILTGWGLNKLTGGALGGIAGELGKGLIKGVLGMTAGVVNINAGVVNGGGAGPAGAAGKAGGALGGAAMIFPLAAVGGLLVGAAGLVAEPVRQLTGVTSGGLGTVKAKIGGLELRMGVSQAAIVHAIGEQKQASDAKLEQLKDQAQRTKDDTVAATYKTTRAAQETKRETSRGLAIASSTTRSSSASNAAVISGAIRANRPNIRVTVTNNVTASKVTTAINKQEHYGPGTGSNGGSAWSGTGEKP